MTGVRRGLVVCTANVCRSPVAERLLQRAIGDAWSFRSAGLAPVDPPIDPNTVRAAAAVGVDLADHRRRQLDATILATDGADLVLVMARAQLRDVVAMDAGAWRRTFTLKELGRRAGHAAPPSRDESFDAWLRRVADGRRATDLMGPSPLDDVADPYGLPRPAHVAMVDELTRTIDALASSGPWTRNGP